MPILAEIGITINKDQSTILLLKADIDVEDIIDVCECEVFDLDLKDINERMFNLINK